MNKDFILKKRKDFVRVAKGQHVAVSTVVLQAAPSLSQTPQTYKVGFTTTKKLGKAHIRNRARRRMRAAARELFPKYGLDNTEYVMIGRFDTASCPFKTLKNDLKWAIKKIHKLMNGENNTTNESAETIRQETMQHENRTDIVD